MQQLLLITIGLIKRPAYRRFFLFYLALNNEIITPNNPTTAIPMMINPIGIPPGLAMGSCAGNEGIIMGGGAVNVGNWVGGTSTRN
jgi:hypothetical protein